MKNILNKNRIIITVLAIMIVIAGYLNFSSKDISLSEEDLPASVKVSEGETGDEDSEIPGIDDAAATETTSSETANEDTTNKDMEGAEGNSDDSDVSAAVSDTIDDGEIGEAVLTSSQNVTSFMTEAKLNREQVRQRSKDMLMQIIDDNNVSDDAKQKAVDEVLALTDDMEKENETETALSAKGFKEAIVSISDSGVEVVIGKSEISDEERAQIEDIVVRKTGVTLDKVIITTTK